MREVVIVGAKRTPIGSFLGALQKVTAPDLGSVAISAALKDAGISGDDVQEVFMGCVLPAGVGQAPARQAALKAGIPEGTPCTTVNKVCGSGLKTILLGAQAIAVGEVDIVVAGGMENMSLTPHLLVNSRTGQKMGPIKTIDCMVHDGLWDPYNDQHMGNCGELCAKEHNISREAQDEFAVESYRRAVVAQKEGVFASEIAPVTVKGRKGDTVVEQDEEPGRGRPEKIPALRPAFQKDGTITAGNASSLNDGAAAVVLMSAEEAKKRGLTPLATIVSNGQHAQAPEWFTTAPAKAIEKACSRAKIAPAEIDVWEINEAFAVVSIANNKLLSLDAAKVNVYGGAVALGHPIGATGTRLVVTLLNAMKREQKTTGGASLCIGGGEGLAIILKREPSW